MIRKISTPKPYGTNDTFPRSNYVIVVIFDELTPWMSERRAHGKDTLPQLCFDISIREMHPVGQKHPAKSMDAPFARLG